MCCSVRCLMRCGRQLEQGRSGVDIALELYEAFREEGLYNVYLVPPIRRGGARNYEAAREFLAQVKTA